MSEKNNTNFSSPREKENDVNNQGSELLTKESVKQFE